MLYLLKSVWIYVGASYGLDVGRRYGVVAVGGWDPGVGGCCWMLRAAGYVGAAGCVGGRVGFKSIGDYEKRN